MLRPGGVSTTSELQRRALGAYLGLAVGDALGATTEFMTPREIQQEFGVHREILGGGWLRLKPGQVTDDTAMSLALGRTIIEQGRVDAQAVAEAFSDWMRSKPIDIGNTVRRGVMRFRRTGETEVPENEQDAGNGACMRALPIALYCLNQTDADMVRASRLQSHVTHHNPVADAGTETLMRMLIAAMKGAAKTELKSLADALVAKQSLFGFEGRSMENPSGWIVETLKAVFQAFFTHNDFNAILVDVVNRGGDADTTGAIAGMLAGAYYGLDAIPERWLTALDGQAQQACESQALGILALAS